ncbi:similar to Saccharomyces cerevisiae YGR281W YOR1 Plasma membrane ATP-binding cassette (ABC) transporter, multidrug transporter mediates export of many different organic anions including oligomycin [Maudiozyma barnettii]|nr:similar to Saccharomyces cerevisiae YGR281W YOR1 Plasma membrane ATP-binding cassette (ABC) transporter, multidrug transporter mediates export of many different organic anions including oligomycin [Kazachstania barnettii]
MDLKSENYENNAYELNSAESHPSTSIDKCDPSLESKEWPGSDTVLPTGEYKVDKNIPQTYLNSEDIERITDSDIYPQKRLLSLFFSKKIDPIPDNDDERKVFPLLNTNIISKAFMWWVTPLLRKGYKRTLQPNDMYKMDERMSISTIHSKFLQHYRYYQEKAQVNYRKEHPEASENEIKKKTKLPKLILLRVLFFTFRKQYLLACLMALIANCALGFNPMLTKRLIAFVEEKAMYHHLKVNKGIGYAIGATLIMLLNGFTYNHFFHYGMLTGSQAKSVLTRTVLEKMFKMSNYSKHKYPSGKVITFITNDLARIEFALMFQPFIVGFPAIISIATVLLIVNLGAIALVGLGLFFIALICTMFLFKKMFDFRIIANVFTDERVSKMREILSNMKMVKYYAWEDAYETNIRDIRSKEIKALRKMQYTVNFIFALAFAIPNISSLVTFLCMYRVNNMGRTPSNLFSSLSLFQVLSIQMFFFPIVVGTSIDLIISLGRVQNLLESEEEESQEIDNYSTFSNIDPNIAIKVDNASFEWEDFELLDSLEKEQEETNEKDQKNVSKDKKELIKVESKSVPNEEQKDKEKSITKFTDLNFEVKKGEFVMITGPIGSGKTSLLNALNGTMNKTKGSVYVNGSLLMGGYPWIQNATVKGNILFGCPFNQTKYDKIIKACCLEDDMKILPAGDKTEIGERGINLSGGQKARINLARAVYRNEDIFLFDDVLSAVDARVGKTIMEECLCGLLSGKTRLLATHQLSLLERADRVIVLDSDGSFEIGTVDRMKKENETLINLLKFSSKSKETKKENIELNDMVIEELVNMNNMKGNDPNSQLDDGNLIIKEERAVNSIKFGIYKEYINSGIGKAGGAMILLLIFLIASTTFFGIFSSVWLSYWTEDKFSNRSTSFYMGMYSFFVFGSFIFMAILFTLICHIGIMASKKLNLKAVGRILHTPMSFLDTTPMGRILNRFTKDTDALDHEITDNLRLFLYQIGEVIGVCVMCIVYLPWFAIAIPFILMALVVITDHYQSSGREIRRLEAVQRSYVYNNINEVLGGMETIRNYRAEARFQAKSDYLIDKMNEASYLYIAVQVWVAIFLDIVATAFALIITLLCVTRAFPISAGSVGVLLSYVLQLPSMFNNVLRAFTQCENDMNSAERLVEYATKVPLEAAYKRTDYTPNDSWPQHGVIEFSNVFFAYRPGLPPVLKNINLNITDGEKIGICGRTGAGKSTIMSALYRLNELNKGTIKIDGVDISKLGLYDLRRKLTIIPQDPVLFKGTIRKNLDPFGEYDDKMLWNALEKSGAIEQEELSDVKLETTNDKDTHADMHRFHLDQVVEEEGTNFSLGERQVLALSRALVRQSKILILDEATSSVDYETDNKIQKRIVDAFSECTILCIAHRIKTILDYDRIIVMDKGEIVESNSPWKLYSNESSIFRDMCIRSGITDDDFKH